MWVADGPKQRCAYGKEQQPELQSSGDQTETLPQHPQWRPREVRFKQASALQWRPGQRRWIEGCSCWAASNPAEESKIRSEDGADAGAIVNVSVTDSRVISRERPLLKPDWSGPRRRFLDRNSLIWWADFTNFGLLNVLQELLTGTFTGPRYQNCCMWNSEKVPLP